MAAKEKKGLGTGLAALFADADIMQDDAPLKMVAIEKIEPRSDQPRKIFDEESLSVLAESISRFGLIQPITVRELENGYYQIVAGERRWRASRMAGLSELPVRIVDADDIRTAQLALVENLQREDLNPIEEAEGFKKLIDEFSMTQEEAAKRHDTLNAQLMAFYDGLMVAEIDTDGKLVNMSKRMVRFYGLNNESVDGLAYISVVAQDDAARESFKNFWDKLLTNGKGQRKMEANIHGKDTYAVEYYKVINKNDEPYRVIVIAVSKMRERELADRLASELQSYLQEHGLNSGEETKE